MFGFLAALVERYGDVVSFDLGRSPYILVHSAPLVRELLLRRWAELRKPEFLKDSNRGHWGDGLTTLEGPAWRERRRMLRPSFSARSVAARLPVVLECTEDMLARWEDGAEVDLLREVRMLTGRIAGRLVLDAELEGYGTGEGRSGVLPFDELYGEDYASVPGGDDTAPLVMVRPRAPRRMDATLRVIDERLASGEDRGDVLSELLRARSPDGSRLTREEVAGELIQMLYAGHHTIPSTLVSFWRDAEAHRLDDAIAGEAAGLELDGGVEPGVLADSLCMAVIKESMRVHPPAPILYREVERPFELDGFAFQEDVAVWVCPQLLHHDPRYFPEPERFLPERFQRGGLSPASESVYLPFGAGPRTCIGNHLALQQMTLMALVVARRVRLSPVPGDPDRFLVSARRGKISLT